MAEPEPDDVGEQSEFTPPPETPDNPKDKPKTGFLKNKWAKITALGMAGLLAVIWYVSIWAKP